MDELTPDDWREHELPRWVQVPVGFVLALFTLFCAFASLYLLLLPGKAWVLGFTVGLVLLFGCLWVLEKCFRLITGRKNQGGLIAPNTLRRFSYALLLLPIVGLFTGYYRKMGLVAVVQAMFYVSAFFSLRALSRKRDTAQIKDEAEAHLELSHVSSPEEDEIGK